VAGGDDLNFTRHRQLTHRLLPQMIEGKWGRVINITGKSEPEGVNGAFCAKAAVHAWSKGLSREVGKHGITVNCIPPGRIMSDQIRRNYTPEYRAWQSEHEIPWAATASPRSSRTSRSSRLAAGRIYHRCGIARGRGAAPLSILSSRIINKQPVLDTTCLSKE
jgi:NAD(P)-dependent dehydrogenase (short-subunit alcohol dehydrogenase family)